MRRSPRLHQGHDPARAVSRPPAAGPASLPSPQTPQSRDGKALDALFQSLDSKWKLGLKAFEAQPTSSQNQTTVGDTYAKIKRAFWTSRQILYDITRRFDSIAPNLRPDERLRYLHGMLKTEAPSRTATPVNTRNVPPKTLLGRCNAATHMTIGDWSVSVRWFKYSFGPS